MLVSTTTEMIENLQDYERRNGIGAIRSMKNLLKYPQLMTNYYFLT